MWFWTLMTRSSDGSPRMMEKCQTSLRKEPPEFAVSESAMGHGRGTVAINEFLQANLAIADQ